MQRILSHAAQALTAEVLQNELQTAVGQQATADLVHACSKDLAARVFTAQLSDKDNRLTRGEFVTWTRRYLQLPPLMRLGNAKPRTGFDYEMESCLGTHSAEQDSWLDLYG